MRLPFKLQCIILDDPPAVQLRAGTAVFHLTDIEIAAVGNIQSFAYNFSFHSLHLHRKSRSALLLLIGFGSRFFCCLLFFHFQFCLPFGGKPCFLRFGLRRIVPRNVILQIFQQMLTGGFEFITDKTEPQQPNAEGIFFILRLVFDAGGTPLHQRLMADSEAQLDI